jgi:hypothetical protein
MVWCCNGDGTCRQHRLVEARPAVLHAYDGATGARSLSSDNANDDLCVTGQPVERHGTGYVGAQDGALTPSASTTSDRATNPSK